MWSVGGAWPRKYRAPWPGAVSPGTQGVAVATGRGRLRIWMLWILAMSRSVSLRLIGAFSTIL